MKKILFVGHEASRTGAPRSLLNIAKLCASNGFSIEFILGRPGHVLAEYEALAATHLWAPSKSSGFRGFLSGCFGRTASDPNVLVEKIRQNPPDIIINNTIATGPILEYLARLGSPIVSRISELETVIQAFGTAGAKVLTSSDMFVAASQAVKDNLVRNHGIAGDNVRVIYGFAEAVDLASYTGAAAAVRRELGIPEDAFVVGNCSNLIYRKGFDYFIEAAARLHERGVYFLWVGAQLSSISLEEVLYDIEKRGLGDTVKFVGEQEDVYPYLSACNALFLSSREDPFPVVMLEAAQCGLPIIGFKGSGGVEEFLAGGGGLLAKYADIDEVCSMVCSLGNSDFYGKLSRQSRTNFCTYGRETAAHQWLNLINSRIC